MRRRAKGGLLGAVLVLALISGARMCAAPSVAPAPVAVPVPPPAVAPRVETLRLGGRFGHVTVVTPPARPGTVVLLLAEGPADRGRALELSMALASHGALVLGVDAGAYLRALEKGTRCAYPAGDLEVLSQGYQRHAELPEYLHPVLVGDGTGAALAYAALAQAPPGTFRGAVSVDFSPEVTMSAAFCPGAGLVRSRADKGRQERLEPPRELSQPWVLLGAEQDPVHPVKAARDFTRSLTTARVLTVPGPGLARMPVDTWRGALLAAHDAAAAPLSSEVLPPVSTSASPPDAGTRALLGDASVEGLPLVEVPATSQPPGDTLALFVTGDGGWASLDQKVSESLAAQGLPVVGFNSLRYFWKRRTPEETSADVARALRHYLAAWGKQRVVLLGYSRGADVVPAIAARLPEDLRGRVRLAVLLAPGKEAEFEVHVTDLFGGRGRPTAAVLPDVQALKGTPVLCVYGDEELSDSLCPTLSGVPGARAVLLKGGHHFDGDYDAIVRVVLRELGMALP
ncbi:MULTISPECIES: virulence factor family protein [unclassified Corallococcus]|uniref:virulence factor family protein n=1 Tax=unclassified Corallococcus TaxID=2685029 RepID=UPI001A8CC63D|nr:MULTISPECIES: virulence factor family protein [unclassified Corallococcus]MBN9684176.1 virulence factor family protein [Corallococcus sp. NCSPR001]WAS84335.1 virulence factor family protein [Corallococcus sp. NCRR]